jgi:hypothetical protein
MVQVRYCCAVRYSLNFVILSEAKDLCILLAQAKSRSFASLRMTSHFTYSQVTYIAGC